MFIPLLLCLFVNGVLYTNPNHNDPSLSGKMDLDDATAAGDDAMSTRSAAGSQSSELSVDRLAGRLPNEQ